MKDQQEVSLHSDSSGGTLKSESQTTFLHKFKALFAPKRFAYTLKSILLANIITLPLYACMLILDAVIHFYLVIMIILKVTRSAAQVDQAEVFQLNVVEYNLKSSVDKDLQLIVLLSISGVLLLVIVMFVIVLLKTDSMKSMGTTVIQLKRVIGIVFISLMTFLQLPMFLFICGVYFIDYGQVEDQSNSTTIEIVLYSLGTANLVTYLILVYFLEMLYTYRVPTSQIHWACSNNKVSSMGFINRLVLALTHLYISSFSVTRMKEESNKSLFLTVPVCLLFLGTVLARSMLMPYYRKLICWLTRGKELITSSLLMIAIIVQIINAQAVDTQQQQDNYMLCLLVCIISIPSVICLSFLIENRRKEQLWKMLEDGTLRQEFEIEHALHLLIKKIKKSLASDQEKSNYNFSDLLSLVERHSIQCNNQACPCKKKEIVLFLLNRGNTFRTNRYIVDQQEQQLLNSQITSSPFINTEGNQNKYKTLTMLQILSQTFAQTLQQQSGPSSKVDNNNNQQITDQCLIGVSLAKLKASFISQFSDIFFQEARRKYPNSQRLYYQYVHFSLQICKNRYMTETLLRSYEIAGINSNGNTGRASWLNKIAVKMNDIKNILDIEKYQSLQATRYSSIDDSISFEDGEKSFSGFSEDICWGIQYLKNDGKQTHLGNTGEDQKKSHQFSQLERFDPEYFILISDLVQDFYEETELFSNIVQDFWRLIQQEQLDVQVMTSKSVFMAETIANVYKIFHDIERASESATAGGKMSDFRVCYIFALMQRLLLNDQSQYELYLAKMNTQKEMLRLLRNNMLQQQVKGPEETGFALVNGSTKQFGNIILCNQYFRKQLGFNTREINSMNIQEVMPSQIKKWHRGFVNDFNRSGGQSAGMLNRTTFMFIKKKNGYIVPTMVHVKFHYSKDYEFTYALFVTFLSEIQLKRSSGSETTKTSEILFFICDDLDGRITDISESCHDELGLSSSHLQLNDLELAQDALKIEDLCPKFSLRRLRHTRLEAEKFFTAESMIRKNELEVIDNDDQNFNGNSKIVDIDLSFLKKTGNQSGITRKLLKQKVQLRAFINAYLENY